MKNKRFFGLHFDFHAGNEAEIGANTLPEDIEWYINQAKPDFIQCDCKGHPGNSSYPTKVGKAADNIVKDNLRIWSDTARKNDIPLYIHYSGVIDGEYTAAHPEDSALDKDGNPTEKICLFGNYADKVMIPQLKEIITEYGIQGAWIDGDCWAVECDYSEEAKKRLPDNFTEEEHKKLMHDAFLAYVKHYVDEIHDFAPDFKITSNWAYTSYIPEKPEIGIDFISGDYPHANSVHEARYESRVIAQQGKPWDLMAWGFEWSTWSDKSAVQLCQEASMTLSQGGGFQVYIVQNADGSPRKFPETSTRLSELGEFVHSREICFEKNPVAQVGIFYSAESYYKGSNIFNAAGVTQPMIGVLNAVLDIQYTANIIPEHKIDTIDDYGIIIIPEWEYINDELKKRFIEYSENGGNLIITGTEACRQFGECLGLEFETVDKGRYIVSNTGEFGKVDSEFLNLATGKGALYSGRNTGDHDIPAYRVENVKDGKVIFVPFGFGKVYFSKRSFILEDYLKNILNDAEMPYIEINKKNIDITLQEGGLINLVNMNQGRHSLDYIIYRDIPEIHDVEITVNRECENVLMPFGEDFKWCCENGKTKITLDKLKIHSIIVLE